MKPKNMLVYAATESEILAPERVRSAARRIRETGFDSVYLEFRNVKAARSSKRFHHGLQTIVNILKDEGLYVALEASFNNLDSVLLEEAPDSFTDSLRIHRARVEQGKVALPFHGDVSTWTFPFAAFVEWNGDQLKVVRPLDLGEPDILLEGGGCAMTRHPGRTTAVFEWQVASIEEGSDVVIVTRKLHEYAFKDLGHPELLRRLPVLLESRARTGADELFLDEPHFGFAFYDGDGRAISDRLFQEFKRQYGYHLNEFLPALWYDCDGVDAARVRLHYSELLEGSLEAMERVILDTCERLTASGFKTSLGGHRTMHEELSDDVLIGCSDYFRHDSATSASYTDSVFERPDSMAAMGQLARSMAVRSQGRDAWNMSWGFHPTPGQQRFYANLLGAMNVRWCLHAWNDSMMFGPGYPHHPCWSSMAEDLSVHRAHVEQLEDWEPVVDSLLLYNWRAAAVVTGAVRHVHRRALILLAWTFTRRSVPFVFVDGDGLAKRLETEPRVRRVVLHWSEALPASAWRGLLDWVQKGGELTIIGPPPTMFSDASQIHSLAEDLAGVRFSQRKVPFGIGGQVRWQDVDFAVRPELLSPRLDDAPESTWLDSWPVRILEPVDARAVSWSDGAVIGTRCGRGEGTVTTATFEPSLVPGMIERIFGWNEDPVREVHFRYQRSAELKTVTIPWLDNP